MTGLTTVLLVDALGEFLQLETLLNVAVSGLAKSALFIMIAAGLSLIFGLMGVLNFTHGAFTMAGAYLGGMFMVMMVNNGTSPLMTVFMFLLAAGLTFVVLFVLGGGFESQLIRPLYDRPPVYQILLTFGATLVLEQIIIITVLFYGLQPRGNWTQALGTKPALMANDYELFVLSASGLELFQICMGILTVVGVGLFLYRTRFGLLIRAGSEDSEMIEAMGFDIHRIFTVVFAFGIGLTGIAGTILMWDPAWGASINLAIDTLLPAFIVVIIGGLGSFRGTVYASIIVGMTDAVMNWWFIHEIKFVGLPEITIFILLVIVLIVKPQGLFGIEEVGDH
jgi:branched-chain amino acid transport system permease protein